MIPTQISREFKRTRLKLQLLEIELGTLKTSQVMIATELGLDPLSDLGDILAGVKHLKAIQTAVVGK
jgi:hypothetical protein